MRRTVFHIVPAALGVLAVGVSAQTISRDAYHHHLPPMTRLVTETAASARLQLYGDTSDGLYRDEAPADGIDDARGRQLQRIALRFSPILRRNNFSAPRFFGDVFGGRPVLQLDIWSGGRRIRSDSILLAVPSVSQADGGEETDGWLELARADALLLKLLEEHHPRRGASRLLRAEGEEETVVFFDFPGEDAKSWRAAYRDAEDYGTYAHFFVHEDASIDGEARYTLVVQYWFFYPFNDSGNNHEGDWEHLAVLLTTRERASSDPAGGRLTESDVRRILTEADAIESLVIREVEYYFHESVVTVPYQPDARPPRTRWEELLHLHVWEQEDYIENVTRERLTHLEGRLATHPIGYIGGNNKGPDELTNLWPRFLGSYNRNGHGTYPFAGTWQGVGPLGATEQLSGRTVPRLRKGADPADDTIPLEELFDDEHFIAFDESEIVLVPDWERVADLVMERADVRRAWSWLVLPVRWGFPASASPGGGAIAHVDVGQVAPEGPTFQPTWNRLAVESGFHVYQPRVLRALFSPMTPWDRLSSGWGFLNIPKTLLGFVPGWSVVLAQLGPWLTGPLEAVGAPPPKVFAPERTPHRLSSFGIGWHRQSGGRAFARLLPQPQDSALAPLLSAAGAGHADEATFTRGDGDGLRAWLSLHYGERFSVQNTIGRSTSILQYTVRDADDELLGNVRGTLEMNEITGGFRYRVASGFREAVQIHAGAGWGWTWYDVDGVDFRDTPFAFERKGGYPVSILPSARWWPNTWYGTVGFELVAPHAGWMADRIGYGLQFEYTGLLHRLGATRPGREGSLGSVARREVAVGLVVSW